MFNEAIRAERSDERSSGHLPPGQVLRSVVDARSRRPDAFSGARNLLLILIFACTLGIAAPNPVSALQVDVPLEKALVIAGGESTNPRDYDPATTYSSGDKLIFSGLVSFDPKLSLTPDLAEKWDVSADGTVYTFHLRQNAKFHNGRALTAQDVIYSWERAASPALESDTVLTYLGDILGVREMASGQADHIEGLRALDDHTLQVTIDAPKPYFLYKLTYPTAFVVDKENVESGSEWFRQPNSTGPYRLREWKRFESIVYEANPDFYLGAPSIPYVVVQLYSGVGIRLYESDEIDLTGISRYDADRFLDASEPLHNELLTGVNLCTGYITFDTTRPPFDDLNVRKAFSMAFDRQKYIDVVLGGHALPAHGLYPPGLPGFNIALKGLPYDPEQARQYLAQSKYGGPQRLPPIVFTDAGIGTSIGADIAALAEMWEQNLGVTITVENLEPDYFLDQIYSGNHGQLISGGWCADYPDPENFADVLFHSGSTQNNGGYSNIELDTLLEAARVEQDVTRRIAMYQQAEKMLVDDAAALFTTHSLSYQLVKPYVKGYVFTPMDISIERYMWLQGK
jgi:oligopeptide transport system substrate-binding protein